MKKKMTISCCLHALLLCVVSPVSAQLSKALLDVLPDSVKPSPAGKTKLSFAEEKSIITHISYFPINPTFATETDSIAQAFERDARLADTLQHFSAAENLSTYYTVRGKTQKVLEQYEVIDQLIGKRPGYASINRKYQAFKAIQFSRNARYEESSLLSHTLLDAAKADKDTLGMAVSYVAMAFPEFALDRPENGVPYVDSSIACFQKKMPLEYDFLLMYYTVFSSKYLGNFYLYEKTGGQRYLDSMRSSYYYITGQSNIASPLLRTYPVIAAYANKQFDKTIYLSDSLLKYIPTLKDLTPTNLFALIIIKKYKALSLHAINKVPGAIAEMRDCVKFSLDMEKVDTTRTFFKTTIIQLSSMLIAHDTSHNNWQSAYYYLSLIREMQEKIDVMQGRGRIFESNQKYDFSKKEAEVKQLEADNTIRKKQRDIAIISTIAAILSLTVITLWLVNRNRKLQLKKKLAEQDALNKIERLNIASQVQIDELEEKNKQVKIETQKRMGQDLHDDLAGTLAAIRIRLNNEAAKVPGNELQTTLTGIAGQIAEAYNRTRDKSHQWYNADGSKDDIAFSKRVRLITENALGEKSYTKDIMIDDELVKKIDMETRINILRIIQEAVTNILKHARAHHLIILIYEADNNLAVLKISDDGKGIDLQNKGGGVGLQSIRARVEEMRGELNIYREEQGTTIKVTFPTGSE